MQYVDVRLEAITERAQRMAKKVKVGVNRGGGPPPGYEWSVWVLDFAFGESHDLFTIAQYEHLVMQVQELARQAAPSHSNVLSVRPIEDYHELRDKGGILGGINARVFFGIDKVNRAIVILGAIKKQNDGPTPQGDKIRMRRRWRKYCAGDYGQPDNV